MKLLRYGPPHHEQPGILDAAGNLRSLAGIVDDIAGATLSAASLDRLRALDLNKLPLVGLWTEVVRASSVVRRSPDPVVRRSPDPALDPDPRSPSGGKQGDFRSAASAGSGDPRRTPLRIAPCVAGVGKFMCIGLNYADHIAETGAAMPAEPVLFMKATSAISGPYDDIRLPRGSTHTDWEVELGVIIGSPAKYVHEEEALDYVAGYSTVHDVSERHFQKDRGGQWTKGKSCDTFGPIGPWLVTKDEVPDPQNLRLWLEVDGERRQDSTTANMIFTVRYLVSYLSQFFTLHPGDIISTGTPAGVGLGCHPPSYLRPGQTVRLSVEGLGEQQQRITTD